MSTAYSVNPQSFWTASYSIGLESGEAVRCENCKRWVPKDRILYQREEMDETSWFIETYGEVPPGYPSSGVPNCGPCSECHADDINNPDFIGLRLVDELVRDVLYVEGVTPSEDPAQES